MTQYPNPYNAPPLPQGYWYFSQYALLAPARYASIFTLCVGGLILMGGVCFGLLGWLATDQIMEQMLQSAGDAAITTGMMRAGLIAFAVVAVLLSLALLALAIFVWRGSVAAIITTIVIVSLVLLFAIFNSISSLLAASGAGGAQLVGAGCFALLVPTTLIALIVMLTSALKAARRASNPLWQQQALYWQYQQPQYSVYGQPGYGYGPPPIPPPPPPPPQGDDATRAP